MSVAGARRAVLAAVAALVIAAAGFSAPANAGMPPTKCGTLHVSGKAYKIATHLLQCDFARKWSKRYLKNGDHPKHWSCTSYPPEQTRTAFVCRKGTYTYYAVRK